MSDKPTFASSLAAQEEYHQLKAGLARKFHNWDPRDVNKPPLPTWEHVAKIHEEEAHICGKLKSIASNLEAKLLPEAKEDPSKPA